MNHILGILDAYNDMSKREFFHEESSAKIGTLGIFKITKPTRGISEVTKNTIIITLSCTIPYGNCI